MKILAAIIFALVFLSCATQKIKPDKPFVIVDKAYVYKDNVSEYRFTDARGRLFLFYGDSKLFEIGDSIK
jgi:hypothetical protein